MKIKAVAAAGLLTLIGVSACSRTDSSVDVWGDGESVKAFVLAENAKRPESWAVQPALPGAATLHAAYTGDAPHFVEVAALQKAAAARKLNFAYQTWHVSAFAGGNSETSSSFEVTHETSAEEATAETDTDA